MTDAVAALEIENLRVMRGAEIAVGGLSLRVARGSIHALVGPNGCGKSTVLESVLGRLPFEGRIRAHFSGSGRIGYVPQASPVDPTLPLTAGEFLALARTRRPVCLGLSAAMRGRVAALLAGVGLTGYEDRHLAALSGGELQRVLLAHALDPAPDLLLLDEPAKGLDAASSELLEREVVRLRAAGTTVLLVSHDLDQVRRICDAVTRLGLDGARTGTPAEVLA